MYLGVGGGAGIKLLANENRCSNLSELLNYFLINELLQ